MSDAVTEITSVDVVVTAAGASTRMGGCKKKEYLGLGSGTVLSAAVQSFFTAAECSRSSHFPFRIEKIAVTVPFAKEDDARTALASLPDTIKDHIIFVLGGSLRQHSVFNGLRLLALYPADMYLIHDGARPFISSDLICRVVENTATYSACAPGTPVIDTPKLVDSNGFVTEHLHREQVCAIQTPQGFFGDRIFEAYEKAVNDGCIYTDDTAVWGKYCGAVYICNGDLSNRKITYPEDLPHGIAK